MQVILQLDENEIAERAKEIVANRLADELEREIRGSRQESLSYRYHLLVREIIREILKSNYDKLAREAVSAASKSIENRALKDKLSKLLEE